LVYNLIIQKSETVLKYLNIYTYIYIYVFTESIYNINKKIKILIKKTKDTFSEFDFK